MVYVAIMRQAGIAILSSSSRLLAAKDTTATIVLVVVLRQSVRCVTDPTILCRINYCENLGRSNVLFIAEYNYAPFIM